MNRTAEQTAQAQQMTGLALEQIYKANLKLGKPASQSECQPTIIIFRELFKSNRNWKDQDRIHPWKLFPVSCHFG